MKLKKLSAIKIIFVLTLIAYLAATVTFCYTTKPKITQAEFPFSITYEYKGETNTLSGVFECEYSGSNTIHGEHDRYWMGESKYDNPDNMEDVHIVEQNDELQILLAVHENMYAGYFMGDPLYKDYYAEYGLAGVEPYIEYQDSKNEISLDEENKEEILKSIGFKIVDYTYAEPIENSFSFSGIEYKADHVVIFIAISVVCLILCLIIVRKEKAYQYTKLDKFGIFLNFLMAIVIVPCLSVLCMAFGIVESNVEFVNQIIYNIPAFTILCLALSVVFRRKGFSKTGFYIQFGTIIPFVLALVAEYLFIHFST